MKFQSVAIQMKATKQYFAVSWCSGNVRYAYLINVDFSCGKQRPRRSWSFNFLPNLNGLQVTWKVKMKENQNKS